MKKYTCPDCGKEFQEGFVPSECPNCGCPSSEFQYQNIENKDIANSNSNESIKQFIVLLVIIGITCGGGYAIYSSVQNNAEKQRYELREKERVKRERREDRKRADEERQAQEKIERENRKAFDRFVGTYSSGHIDAGNQSGTGQFYITFNRDKTFYLRFVDSFTRNVLESWRGTYTYYYETGGQLLTKSGAVLQRYYIENSYTISINGERLTKD